MLQDYTPGPPNGLRTQGSVRVCDDLSLRTALSEERLVIATAPSDWKELREKYSALVRTFGDGWEKGDAGDMASVFTEEGVFLPSPFDPPVKGRAAVLAYWKDTPLEQAEVAFRFGEIFVAGPWFSTEIKCTFRRRRTGNRVDVRGALFCETEDDLISEMRMYWHRVSGQPDRT